MVPGDTRPAFAHSRQARQVLNDAEEDLREWIPNLEPIPSAATGLGGNLVPSAPATIAPQSVSGQEEYTSNSPIESRKIGGELGLLESADRRDFSGNSTASTSVQPEPTTGYQH